MQPSLKSGLSALCTQSMQQQSPEEGWPHTPAMAERVISAPPHTTLHAHSQSAPWAPYQEMLSDSIRHQFDQTPHQTSVDTDGCESRPVVSNSLQPHGPHSPWNSPGNKTGVGSLLQGTFPTQGSNPGLPHCRRIPNQLCHKGSPRILEWAAYPFSGRSSRPRNRTGVSCTAGRFFTS